MFSTYHFTQKKTALFLVAVTIFVGMFFFSPHAHAQSTTDLLSMIAQLKAQILEIQNKISAQSSSSNGESTTPSAQIGNGTSCLQLTSTLYLGSTDARTNGEVSKLQQFLKDRGYLTGAPTGYFGHYTQVALQKWQSANGVATAGTPVTTGYGAVGPKTRAALVKDCGSTIVAPEGVTNSWIKVVSPNEGAYWYHDTPVEVKWTTVGIPSFAEVTVRLRSVSDNNVHYSVGGVTYNGGSLSFKVPTSIPYGSYYVEVKTIHNGVSYLDKSDEYIKIVPVETVGVKVVRPNDGEKYTFGDMLKVSWVQTGSVPKGSKACVTLQNIANGKMFAFPSTNTCIDIAGEEPELTLSEKLVSTAGYLLTEGTYKVTVTLKAPNPGNGKDAPDLAQDSADAYITIVSGQTASLSALKFYYDNSTDATFYQSGVTKQYAIDYCKEKSVSNPTRIIHCTWGGDEVFSYAPFYTPVPQLVPTIKLTATPMVTSTSGETIVAWVTTGMQSCGLTVSGEGAYALENEMGSGSKTLAFKETMREVELECTGTDGKKYEKNVAVTGYVFKDTAAYVLKMAAGAIPKDLTYDVNKNGMITSADARAFYFMTSIPKGLTNIDKGYVALRMSAMTAPVDLSYDINGSGTVTSADALAFQKLGAPDTSTVRVLVDFEGSRASVDATEGRYVVNFEVTAEDGDVYVPLNNAVKYSIKNTEGLPDNNGRITTALVSSADEIGSNYVVREGETESFTLEVSFFAQTTGSYQLVVSGVQYKKASSDTTLLNAELDTSPFKTDSIMLNVGYSTLSTPASYVSATQQCVDLTTNMHRGAEFASVKALQSFLIGKGLLVSEVTGFYGDLTVAGVRMYQKSVGLSDTGMVYEYTREAIRKETCGR